MAGFDKRVYSYEEAMAGLEDGIRDVERSRGGSEMCIRDRGRSVSLKDSFVKLIFKVD